MDYGNRSASENEVMTLMMTLNFESTLLRDQCSIDFEARYRQYEFR